MSDAGCRGAIVVGGVGSGFKVAVGLDMLGYGVKMVIVLVRLFC